MTYLPIDRIRAGSLEEATGLTLVIPTTRHNAKFVVGSVGDELVAVFLDGQHKFSSMACRGADRWGGILVSNIEIEIDIDSVCDLNHNDAPLGSLIREGDYLAVLGSPGGGHKWDKAPVVLKAGLEMCAERQRACFEKWRIVIEHMNEKIELEYVDASEKAAL